MRIHFATLGCRLNEAESARWGREFQAAGDRVVSKAEDADIVVVNSCAVTSEAAKKSRKLTSSVHRKNPSARLVLTGCFAQLEPEKAKELAGVDLIVSNTDKEKLVSLVKGRLSLPVMPVGAADVTHHAFQSKGRTRAFIKVQDGCRNLCTYCIVTIARGDERSRTIGDVVAEINGLHAQGYQEAVLTGVHLGGYGSDIGTDLKTLVLHVLANTTIPRIRLSSLEPWDLPEGFFSLWENSRLMPHLHLPLQSGCDSVLRRMSRRCYTNEFSKLVADARDAIPDVNITTDIIVGFPGETEEEFAETAAYVEKMGFGHIHVFSFSPREGTKAARLPGQVPNNVKKERSRVIHRLAENSKQVFVEKYAGSERDVLWESQEDRNGQTGWVGYTDNYLRCFTASEDSLKNLITPVPFISVS